MPGPQAYHINILPTDQLKSPSIDFWMNVKEYQICDEKYSIVTLDVHNCVLLDMIEAQQLTCVEVYSAKAAIDNMGMIASH